MLQRTLIWIFIKQRSIKGLFILLHFKTLVLMHEKACVMVCHNKNRYLNTVVQGILKIYDVYFLPILIG